MNRLTDLCVQGAVAYRRGEVVRITALAFAENVAKYTFGSSWNRSLAFDASRFRLVAHKMRFPVVYCPDACKATERGVSCSLGYPRNQPKSDLTRTAAVTMEQHRMARFLP